MEKSGWETVKIDRGIGFIDKQFDICYNKKRNLLEEEVYGESAAVPIGDSGDFMPELLAGSVYAFKGEVPEN